MGVLGSSRNPLGSYTVALTSSANVARAQRDMLPSWGPSLLILLDHLSFILPKEWALIG